MKVRVVKIEGLSSSTDINVAFAVEWKKHFFSRWKEFYKTDFVDSKDKWKVSPRKERCEKLAEALKARGRHIIKTVVNNETDN